jgi:hypothetical protein
MPTLILSPRFTPDSNVLWRTALDKGWQVMRLPSHRVPDGVPNQNVVIYGEGIFVQVVAQQLGLALYTTPTDWLPGLPASYRKRSITLTTLAEARQGYFPAFVKPAADKSFQAQVYRAAAELPQPNIYDEASPVLVSDIVRWAIEYRCFISERQLRTLVAYSRDDTTLKNDDDEWMIEQPEDVNVHAFVQSLLDDPAVALPPAIVIDIGQLVGGDWAVIEANPVWASGIYGNHPSAVLEVLLHSMVNLDALPDEQMAWAMTP